METNSFFNNDTVVRAWLMFENLIGEVELDYRCYDPNNNLVQVDVENINYSSNRANINISGECTAFNGTHELGQWRIEYYANNQYIATDYFSVTVNIAHVSSFDSGTVTDSSVELNWGTCENAWSYLLYRDGVLIAETNELSYIDTTVDPNTSYTYKVVPKAGPVVSVFYRELNITTAEPPAPPEPPNYKVESINHIGWSATLAIAFDTVDPFVDYYVVNVYRSSADAIAGGPGDVVTDQVVSVGSHFCASVTYGLSQPIYFFSIYSVDTDGQSGDHVVGYALVGNAVGNDNDGTAFTSAKVDGAEYTALRNYYFKPFTHSSSDYCGEPDLYNMFPLSYQERMDYNGDGVVDGWEYNLFRIIYGISGASY